MLGVRQLEIYPPPPIVFRTNKFSVERYKLTQTYSFPLTAQYSVNKFCVGYFGRHYCYLDDYAHIQLLIMKIELKNLVLYINSVCVVKLIAQCAYRSTVYTVN